MLGTSISTNRGLLDLIALTRADLVIVSPLDGFLGPSLNMNRAEDMRPMGDALTIIAEQAHCAVIVVRHFTKRLESRTPLHAGLGSISIGASARSVIHIGPHPDFTQPDDYSIVRSVVIHSKNNLGPRERSHAFELRPFENKFIWLPTRNIEAQEILMGPSLKLRSEEKAEIHQAGENLRAVLAGSPGIAQAEVFLALDKFGYNKRTVQRAAARLSVQRTVLRNKKGQVTGSIWKLPD